MNINFEAFLSNEETVRLLGVYHETLEANWKALEVGKAREVREAWWEALEAGKALEAHCKEAYGLSHNQTGELYRYWISRRVQ